jgi:hypothetical protein
MNKTHPNPNLDKPNPKPGAKAMFARPSMQSCGVTVIKRRYYIRQRAPRRIYILRFFLLLIVNLALLILNVNWVVRRNMYLI